MNGLLHICGMPQMLHQNGFRNTKVQMTMEQGIASQHHSIIFSNFSAEISPYKIVSTDMLLNSVFKSLSDVCSQLQHEMMLLDCV